MRPSRSHAALRALPQFARFAFLMLALLATGAAQAVTLDGLYDAEVAVTDDSSNARQRAIRQAMRVVLIRLTGNTRAPVMPGADVLVTGAESYVDEFQFLAGRGGEGNRLRVRFNARVLDGALSDAGLARWSNERPATLLWLFVKGPEQWTPVAPNSRTGAADGLYALVSARAGDRGLPLRWPNYDYADVEALKAEGFDGDPQLAVLAASERYERNAVAYMTLGALTPELWDAEWALVVGDETLRWQGQGSQRDLLVDEAVDALTDAIASRFASSGGGSSANRISIAVTDVLTPTDYGRLLDYFDGVDAIEQVAVDSAGEGRMQFTLVVRGGLMEFERLVALGRLLEPVVGTPGSYRLRR